jgi:hypothetical protein
MRWPEPEGRSIDLDEYDGRLDDLVAIVRAEPGLVVFRRGADVTASSDVRDGVRMFDFYRQHWGRRRDHLMGALTVALTGEDLDEVETEVARAVAEARQAIRVERETATG